MGLRRTVALLAALAFVCGCGGSPPDVATSERQIRQTAIDYNLLAVAGKGEQACALLTEEKRESWMDSDLMRATRDMLPPAVHDCASYWSWLGPRMGDGGRRLMLDTRVSAVSIAGKHATATYATGGTIPLTWSDGRWRLS
jgi:hypothetical protein